MTVRHHHYPADYDPMLTVCGIPQTRADAIAARNSPLCWDGCCPAVDNGYTDGDGVLYVYRTADGRMADGSDAVLPRRRR